MYHAFRSGLMWIKIWNHDKHHQIQFVVYMFPHTYCATLFSPTPYCEVTDGKTELKFADPQALKRLAHLDRCILRMEYGALGTQKIMRHKDVNDFEFKIHTLSVQMVLCDIFTTRGEPHSFDKNASVFFNRISLSCPHGEIYVKQETLDGELCATFASNEYAERF